MSTVADVVADETVPSGVVRTTLYELIEALNAEAGSEEENLVVATVVYLLRSGRVTFPESLEHRN